MSNDLLFCVFSNYELIKMNDGLRSIGHPIQLLSHGVVLLDCLARSWTVQKHIAIEDNNMSVLSISAPANHVASTHFALIHLCPSLPLG